jgi:phosphoribosylformylglycinamidine synthase
MAASCIDEAVRNNTSVGGRRMALLDNFTWGNPEKSNRLGSLVMSCQACYDFAKGFRTPFISGKDSLYNESPLGPVTPTLLITAIGVIPDVRKAVSMDVKQPGNIIYVVGQTRPELGGSQYYQLKGFIGKTVPKVRADKARKLMDSITEAIDSRCVKACHDLSEGGLAVAAAEMAFSGGYGMDLRLEDIPRTKKLRRNDFLLFSESNSRFLVEIPERRQDEFEALMRGNIYAAIGRVEKNGYLSISGLNGEEVVAVNLAELRNRWKSILGG